MLNLLFGDSLCRVFAHTPDSLSHTHKVLIINNGERHILLVILPLVVTSDAIHWLAVMAETIAESLKKFIFCHLALDKIGVTGNIVALFESVKADVTHAVLVNALPSEVHDSLASGAERESQSAEEGVDAKAA